MPCTEPTSPTPTDRQPVAVFPVARASVVLTVSVALLAGVMWAVVAFVLDRPQWGVLNVIGALTCGGAGLLGFVPAWLLSRRSGMQGASMGFLLGMLVRMGLCGAVVLVARANDYAHAEHLAYWVAGWYLAVLAIEVILLSSYIRSAVPPRAAADAPADAAPTRRTETD